MDYNMVSASHNGGGVTQNSHRERGGSGRGGGENTTPSNYSSTPMVCKQYMYMYCGTISQVLTTSTPVVCKPSTADKIILLIPYHPTPFQWSPALNVREVAHIQANSSVPAHACHILDTMTT